MKTNLDALLTSWNTLYAEIPKKYQASVDNNKKQKDDFLIQFRESKKLLELDIQRIQETKTNKEQAVSESESILNQLTEAIDEKLRVRELLEAKIEALTASNAALEQDTQCRKKEKAEIQDMVSRVEQIYCDRLGFKISKVRGSDDAHHFEFKFSNIDSKNPQRIFAIALKVSPGKTVSVTDCQPMVGNLDYLLGELRDTNDWHGFLVELRLQFTRLV